MPTTMKNCVAESHMTARKCHYVLPRNLQKPDYASPIEHEQIMHDFHHFSLFRDTRSQFCYDPLYISQYKRKWLWCVLLLLGNAPLVSTIWVESIIQYVFLRTTFFNCSFLFIISCVEFDFHLQWEARRPCIVCSFLKRLRWFLFFWCEVSMLN